MRALYVAREAEQAILREVERRLTLNVEEGQQRSKLLKKVRGSFLAFLPYWHFQNRETGEDLKFDLKTLWPGQRKFIDAMKEHRWLLALKAGKLGFTELECAWDGWKLVAGSPNTRVHLFSRDQEASRALLGYVRYGLLRLPDSIRPLILENEAGGDTTTSMKLFIEEEDIRTINSYAAGPVVSIDLSCQHLHMDELAHMPFPEKTWNAALTTVSPTGSAHIVSRGAGEDNHLAKLWAQAKAGTSKLFPLFQPWSARSDRDEKWYRQEEEQSPSVVLHRFAPETPEQALEAEEEQPFINIIYWDKCQETLPQLSYDEPLVLGVDAGVTGDCFAIVGVTRHPERHEDPAIRVLRLWTPTPRSPINFRDPDDFIRTVCGGGCVMGHPTERPREGCEACFQQGEQYKQKAYQVEQVAYDPYQLENMAQQHREDGVAWWKKFDQGGDRLIADSEFRILIMQKRLAHAGDEDMRQHMMNSDAKLEPKEESKIRIVKRTPEKKVDLAVAASMAIRRCLYLLL